MKSKASTAVIAVFLAGILWLWPILLLPLVGSLTAIIVWLIRSHKRDKSVDQLPTPSEPMKEPEEKDVMDLAYAVILRRISERIASRYPEARWVWEASDIRRQLEESEEVYILLNQAGGYRRARVILKNLRVADIEFLTCESQERSLPKQEPQEIGEQADALAANEWLKEHGLELNERCNEAIGQKSEELILAAEELPDSGSWPHICIGLVSLGLKEVCCIPKGIRINLKQNTAERK